MTKRSRTAKKDRTYDAEGFTKRAGCLCFKTDREEEVLLITSNSSPDQWIVPAGGVEAGEENEDAANREILEEAGVCGNIVRSLGMFQNDASNTRTMMYVLHVNEVHEMWQDAARGRRRRWFSIEEAWARLSHRPHQQSYLCDVMQSKWRTNPSFALCIDSQSKITKDLEEILL